MPPFPHRWYAEWEEEKFLILPYYNHNLEENKIVDAVYVKAVLDFDRGNRYIEALPYPRSEEAVRYAYTKTLPTYRYDDVKNLSKLEKMLQNK